MVNHKSAVKLIFPVRHALSESRSLEVRRTLGGQLHPKLNRLSRQPASTVKERYKGF